MPENEVHLWVADHRVAADELETCSNLLDPGERDRASRFRFHKDYRRFVFGHARARSILALYSGSSAGALRLARVCAACGSDEHGKPYLVLDSGTPAPLRFSWSYSAELFVLAVANGPEVGVDVETVAPAFDWRQVAVALSAGEQAELDGLDPDAAARAFYAIWTRKEAVAKVSGRGVEEVTRMDTCLWQYGEGGEFEVAAASDVSPCVGKALELPGHAAAVAAAGASGYEWRVMDGARDLQPLAGGA